MVYKGIISVALIKLIIYPENFQKMTGTEGKYSEKEKSISTPNEAVEEPGDGDADNTDTATVVEIHIEEDYDGAVSHFKRNNEWFVNHIIM